jgi:hypothetical protein
MIVLPVRASLLVVVSVLSRLESSGNRGFRNVPQLFSDVPRGLIQSVRRQPFRLSLPGAFIISLADSLFGRADGARGGLIGSAFHRITGPTNHVVFDVGARNRARYKSADEKANPRHQHRILFDGIEESRSGAGTSISRTLA